MMQSFEQGATCQPLQVVTGFAQAYAADLDLTNLEFVADQVIERNAASDQITASFSGRDVYAVIALECFDRFRFNQSQFEIRERLVEGSLTLSIAIAF